MARAVTVELIGDASKLTRAYDQAADAGDELARSMESNADRAREAGAGYDAAAEGADRAEQRAMGFRDTITGLQDSFKGVTDSSLSLDQRLLTLGQGFGDLASGVANFVVPSIKALAGGALQAGIAMVTSSAQQVAAWAVLGVQSLLNAAKVAAAWIIALGPIALVIAAVVGVVALIVANWDKVVAFTTEVWETIVGTITGAWDTIIGFITGLPGKIGSAARGMWDGIWDAFRGMLNTIIRAWNSVEFTVPKIDVGPVHFGGFTIGLPDIPTFHAGGVVPGAPGQNVLAMLQAGERVIPAGASPVGAPTIIVQAGVGDPVAIGQAVVDALKAYERNAGTNWRTAS